MDAMIGQTLTEVNYLLASGNPSAASGFNPTLSCIDCDAADPTRSILPVLGWRMEIADFGPSVTGLLADVERDPKRPQFAFFSPQFPIFSLSFATAKAAESPRESAKKLR